MFLKVFQLICIMPTLALAAPVLDPVVRSFLGSSGMGSAQTLPVLITYSQNPQIQNIPHHGRYHAQVERIMIQNTLQQEAIAFNQVLRGGARPIQTFWIINGSTTVLRKDQLQGLAWSSNIASISYSKKKIKLTKSFKSSNPVGPVDYTYGLKNLKVPELRKKYPNIDGTGIRVGILDSGIDPNHPDLRGKTVLFKDFTPAKKTTPSDEFQHGTHVAGTIAGGAASGTAIGVAPHVQLVIGKIFDGNGSSETEEILAAMQWIADPDGNPNTNDFPSIVSNSWGDNDPYNNHDPQDDAFCKIVDSWVKLGIIPVFAAGNTGPKPGTVGIPAGCPQAFAVGATDQNDRSPWFSSAGPAIWKSAQLVKPDIAAAGLDVLSAQPGGGFQEMTGTSMATPHISGSLALLLQARPSMSVEDATRVLIAGAQDLGNTGKDMDFGWGRPDLLKSLDILSGAPLR
jgi:subtilisin family serine protease